MTAQAIVNNRSKDETLAQALTRVDTRELIGEQGKVIIQHGESEYILRITHSNKLILTK